MRNQSFAALDFSYSLQMSHSVVDMNFDFDTNIAPEHVRAHGGSRACL
jgi:hypothetical protein